MMTTEEIYELILRTVRSGMELVRDGHVFIIAACVIFSITASLDIMRKNGKKAYLSRLTTDRKYHYGLIAGVILLAGWVTTKAIGYNVLCSVLSVLAVLAALSGAFFLLRWQKMGILLTYMSLLFSAGAMDAWHSAVVAADMPNITSYNPGGMYSLLIAADYHFFRAELLWMAVCGIIVFSSGYYMQRRFLFSGAPEKFAVCPHCGKPAAKGEKYCICCGTKLEQTTAFDAPYKILDEGEYCGDCGGKLRDGVCPFCGEKSLKQQAAESFKNEVMTKFRGILAAVITLVLAFSPVIFSKTWDLSKGSAVLNNEYVVYLQEFRENREIAQDDAWFDSYRSAYSGLYRKDCEWMRIPWQSVSRNDLVYFVLYSEASCRQTEAMESIDHAILKVRLGETVSDEEYSELTSAFNASIEDQNAAALTARQYQQSDDMLTTFSSMMIDGLRFWTQWAPIRYIAVLMMIAGFSAALSFLGSFHEETGIRTPFSKKNLHQADVWLTDLLAMKGQKEKASDHYEFKKSGRLVWLYGIALACVIMIFSWAAAKYLPQDSEEAASTEYSSLCSAVLTDRFDDTMTWITNLNSSTHAFTEEEITQMITCFEAQIAADEAYIAYEGEAVDDPAFDERMDAFCAEEKEIITSILDAVRKSQRPDHQLLVRYTALRADSYKDVMQMHLKKLIEDAGNGIIDLAG